MDSTRFQNLLTGTITVNIFINTVKRSFFRGAKELKEEEAALKFFPLPRGEGGGAPKTIEPLAKEAAKISSFEFQYLHPPCCMK